MDCRKIKALALDLALQAGRLQARKFRTRLDIRFKRVTDPVTEVDRACEALIVRAVRRAFPGHAILGEEGGSVGPEQAEVTWVIDPLDGTVNYSHGLAMHAVCIGVFERVQGSGAQRGPGSALPSRSLLRPLRRTWRSGSPLPPRGGGLALWDSELGEPIVGVVHAQALGETFTAQRGEGAFLNGKRIRVSRQSKPLEAVLASGFSYGARVSGENVREWSEMLTRFQAVRRMGAAALDLCYVACGRFDAFWEYGLKPWDVAAAGLVAAEAGALISNIEGKPYEFGKPGIVVSNKPLFKPLVSALKRATARKLAWPPR